MPLHRHLDLFGGPSDVLTPNPYPLEARLKPMKALPALALFTALCAGACASSSTDDTQPTADALEGVANDAQELQAEVSEGDTPARNIEANTERREGSDSERDDLACDNLCEADTLQCSQDASTIERCQTGPEGCFQWTPLATCLAGDLCVAGECITPPTAYDFDAQAPWFSCPANLDTDGLSVVTAFDASDQYFGEPNLRQIEAEVDFPETGSWSQVGLWFQLDCPENGLCDHWDRSGSVQLVLNPDAPEGEPRESLELLRHITPYRVGMCQYIDVTPLAHLLKGKQTLTSWIDTWVGPGHAQGEGWRVTLKFFFYAGPEEGADHVLNVWGRRSITVGEVESDVNVDAQITPKEVLIPSEIRSLVGHLTTTGHSFGNTYNCAEFCQMRHDLIIDGSVVASINPWRPDCSDNPVSPQYGTWEYARNGWCPGASALGQRVDLTPYVTPGESASLDLDIRMYDGAEYDNTSPVDLLPYTYISLKLYGYE